MTPAERRIVIAARRAYVADLRRRTLRVACPHCGAPQGVPCRGTQQEFILGIHWLRKDAAKLEGHVAGMLVARASSRRRPGRP